MLTTLTSINEIKNNINVWHMEKKFKKKSKVSNVDICRIKSNNQQMSM